MRRKDKTPARIPHPDPGIELQLQRIIGCQRAIARYELLIAEYRQQMTSADDEQDMHSSRLRNSNEGSSAQQSFSLGMSAQARRIASARGGIAEAERAIGDPHELIAKLAAGISASDLAYLQ
jgi:hypothetical protein